MNQNSPKHVARFTQVATAIAVISFAQPAWAYLDPGTGSMIISAIVGLFATAALAIKTYWYKLKSFFRKDPPADDDAPRATDSSESTADN
jgi:hypothetical protein